MIIISDIPSKTSVIDMTKDALSCRSPDQVQDVCIAFTDPEQSKASKFIADTTATTTKRIKIKDTKCTKQGKKFKASHQINPVAEACKETVKGT